jgi:hypothetical protein
MALKAWTILLMFVGESVMIACEVQAALHRWKSLPVLALQMGAAVLLLYAYNKGLEVWGSIWHVSAISVITIVLAEPTIVWGMSREVPSTGPAIGFALACLALIVTVAVP